MSSAPADTTAVLSRIERSAARGRTSDLVYDELLHAIRDMRLRPGAGLSETDLSLQFGVSRTPVREAIARLVNDRLVVVVPQVGTRVARISLEEVRQAQFVREHLELAAFALAAKAVDRDTSTMRALLKEQQRAHSRDDAPAFFAADDAFHEQVFQLAGYGGVWAAIQPVKLQLDRLRRSLPDSHTIAELIDEHRAIADALDAGDVRGGRALVRAHSRRVLKHGPSLRNEHPDLFTT